MLPVNESDWKLFRKRLPEWQERCMEQLAESYAALLAGPGKASDKFWELEKRLRKDKKRVGVVADVSRSEMYYNLLYLLDEDQQPILSILFFSHLTASQRISFSLFTLLKLQLSLTSIFKSAKLSVLIRCAKCPGSLLPGLFLCHSTMHS